MKKSHCRVEAHDFTKTAKRTEKHLERILLFAMRQLNLFNREISLSLVDSSQIRKLNRQYRNIDRATDVLSFEHNTWITENVNLLGEIIICVSVAKKQAKLHNRTQKWEFTLLAIHGLLHLVGYDHITKQEEMVMFELQNTLVHDALKHA